MNTIARYLRVHQAPDYDDQYCQDHRSIVHEIFDAVPGVPADGGAGEETLIAELDPDDPRIVRRATSVTGDWYGDDGRPLNVKGATVHFRDAMWWDELAAADGWAPVTVAVAA